MRYRAPRGTTDILPEEQVYWRYVQECASSLAETFGYGRIDTPIFEDTGLFVRTVGEATDIVDKEMYTFEDRGSDQVTLRPEGTAPVCRAYLEHGMHNLPQPVRLYYQISLFRYDRPQAGRYRQFHQFGVEAIGDSDPAVDAEVIELAWRFYERLGLQGLTLALNSIGDKTCRPLYLERLVEYYTPHVEHLCQDCQARIHRNPLRLLDCKQLSCQPYIAEAPVSTESLCDDCREHWGRLTTHLGDLGIAYSVDHRLVRGLDYYSRTVFEILPPEEGSQSTLCGGGRYDGLMEQLGGKPTPGIGFALGIERTILNLKRQGVTVPDQSTTAVAIAHMGEAGGREAVKLAAQLRSAKTSTILLPGQKSLKGQMRHAGSLGARYVVIIGDKEAANGVATVRDLAAAEQREVPLGEVIAAVSQDHSHD
ncbi:MAG: histidyl-tRNA synthetase [Chloroflexi bacterium]|nr:MAG: histidyl-tRNA synthetase [Chloroflexota bacterium]